MGALLDPLADKALLTVALLALAIAGRHAFRPALPPWVAVVSVGRDLLLGLGWAALVAALELQLADQSEPEEAIVIRREMAEVFAHKLGDAPGAILALQGILEHAPGDLRALVGLDELLMAEERWEELRG